MKIIVKECNFDIMGVCETFIDQNIADHEISIDGYNCVKKNRNRHGGGVLVYIREGIAYNEITDLTGSQVESVWISIKSKRHSLAIGVMYRPPSSNTEYFQNMLDQIENVLSLNVNILLMGDLNYDYKFDESLSSNPLHQIEVLYGMRQLINTPTRVTLTTSTLIDVMLSNDYESHMSSGVFNTSLSDHYMIYTVYSKMCVRKTCTHKVIKFRNYRHFNIECFRNALLHNSSITDISWPANAIADKWLDFKNAFIYISNCFAPMETRRLKDRCNPWMEGHIVKSIYKRDHLKRKAVECKNRESWQLYKQSRNQITAMIRLAKRQYYETTIEECQHNPKRIWKVLNHLMHGHNRQSPPSTITAEKFNSFFSTIGMETVSHLQPTVFNDDDNDHADGIDENIFWRGSKCTSLFNFATIQQDSVIKHLLALGDSSNNDVLEFDSKLLFLSYDILAPILTKFYNISINSKIVITDWKLSKVVPIYKGKGSKEDTGNYRPISLIGHIMKIFEKEVKLQVMNYLEINNLITIDQSAYMRQHNTQTALHRVVDDWLYNMSDGNLTGVCSFDITKCFDTIDHSILLRKMQFYGFQSEDVLWFQSYLHEREQIVSCHNHSSEKCKLRIGVPQGSVLGPLLFLIYINDINRHVYLGSCNLYADDTLVYCTGKNTTELSSNMQKCVVDICEWYDKNKLIINRSKSNIMLVSTKQKLSRLDETDLDVYIGDHKLLQCNELSYLGVKIDCSLAWDTQTDIVCKKLVFIVSRLSRLKAVLPVHLLMSIYTSLIQPTIDYAISIWGCTSKQNIYKIQRLQNRAARIITGNYDFINTRGIDLVKNLKWMCVSQRRDYFIAILMFKSIHGLAPHYLCDEITLQRDISTRLTRSHDCNNVYVPCASLECFSNAFVHKGPVIWNALPQYIKNSLTMDSFKINLKMFIAEGRC